MHLLKLILLFSLCIWMSANAQTPYDSFAPETSRPILTSEALSREKCAQDFSSDTTLFVAMIDTQQERILLMDMSNGSIVAYAPLTDNKSHWLSPDPLQDKYPEISPYAYCHWNPMRYVDPDGRDWYNPGDGSITWHNEATSQEAMNKAGIKGIYLGKNVLVGKHGRDNNLNESINGATFELYLETYKEGPIASIKGNTVPCDVDKYGTLREGIYPAKYYEYNDKPAILINNGKSLPTVKGNPNNKQNYSSDGSIKPIEAHIMDEIFFHYGNNYFNSLIDSKGRPWTTGCQTGGNYKGAWSDYMNFMQYLPKTFNGWYYLRSR